MVTRFSNFAAAAAAAAEWAVSSPFSSWWLAAAAAVANVEAAAAAAARTGRTFPAFDADGWRRSEERSPLDGPGCAARLDDGAIDGVGAKVDCGFFSLLSPVLMLRTIDVHLWLTKLQIRAVPSLLPERNLNAGWNWTGNKFISNRAVCINLWWKSICTIIEPGCTTGLNPPCPNVNRPPGCAEARPCNPSCRRERCDRPNRRRRRFLRARTMHRSSELDLAGSSRDICEEVVLYV